MADEPHLIASVDALKAMTHPLRWRMLGSLRLDGPQTASELARRHGESSGSTSYHLRQLERFGYVEAETDASDARLKRWRPTADSARLDLDLLAQPGAVDASLALVRTQVAEVIDGLALAEREARNGNSAWLAAATSSDSTLRLDAEQTAALRDELLAVIERRRAAAAAHPRPGARRVVAFVGVAPVVDSGDADASDRS